MGADPDLCCLGHAVRPPVVGGRPREGRTAVGNGPFSNYAAIAYISPYGRGHQSPMQIWRRFGAKSNRLASLPELAVASRAFSIAC
jgi:hypothetical protein